jgi:hypothetical protein
MNHRTATEVRAMQPEIDRQMQGLQRQLQESLTPMYERMCCHIVLGFCKMENRSPKRLARLKHSMTMATLDNLRAIRFE